MNNVVHISAAAKRIAERFGRLDIEANDIVDTSQPTMLALKGSLIVDAQQKILSEAEVIARASGSIAFTLESLRQVMRHFEERMQP